MTLADEIVSLFGGFNTFTFNDIRMMLADRHRGISDKTIQVTVSRMVKNKEIYAITKGVFSLQRRDELVGFAFSPFYYGGLAALMLRDLIDDQVKMEIMTTRQVKKSALNVYGGSSIVILHHIPRKYYFGFEIMKYGSLTVPVSDPEKTLIDLFYYRRRLPLQDYSGVLKAVGVDLLGEYLRKYDELTRKTVAQFVKKYKPLADAGKLENQY